MSDSKHLAALRKGDVDAWNLGRTKKSFIPDLSRAVVNPMSTRLLERQLQLPEDRRDFTDADLRGAELNGARFRKGTNLSDADLAGATLTGAVLDASPR